MIIYFALALLVAACGFLARERFLRVRDIERLKRENARLEVQLNPSHPNCRCVLLPTRADASCTSDVILEALGIEHRCYSDGRIEIDKSAIRFREWPRDFRNYFEVVKDPARPTVIYLYRRGDAPPVIDHEYEKLVREKAPIWPSDDSFEIRS